jgi:hypothetical protein
VIENESVALEEGQGALAALSIDIRNRLPGNAPG